MRAAVKPSLADIEISLTMPLSWWRALRDELGATHGQALDVRADLDSLIHYALEQSASRIRWADTDEA